MTNEHVERDKELTERLERFVEERGMFPLYTLADDKIIHNLLDMIEELEHKCEQLETQEHVELSLETRERLDKYVEDNLLLVNPSDLDYMINYLLNRVKMLELEREVLFDAVLIAIQRDEDLQTVTDIKERLTYYVNIAFHRTGNFDGVDYDVRRLYELADEHNKTRRYDNGVFQWRG